MTDLKRYGSGTLESAGCSTCSDAAAAVRVVGVRADGAEVEDRVGERAVVAVDLVPGTSPGDVLLVHMGVALRRLEEAV